MWTQRLQLQAYQFLRRRLVSALQTGDANHPVSPSRRLVLGYGVGAVCTLLVVAGFGVYGVLRPGGGQPRLGAGQVVIEKESGARYVFLGDGLLHPVLNYASARLLAGGDGRATVTVSARSLVTVPRGQPVGIPGAPDSLPPPDRLLAGPWTVCAGVPGDRPAGAGPTTTALLGVQAGPPLAEDEAAIVVADAVRYAVFGGRRWRLGDGAAEALGYDRVPAVRVTAAWLSAVPAGPDLGLIAVPGSGTPGPRVGGLSTVVGQVLVVDRVGGERRYLLVRRDGLADLTEVEAALIRGAPRPIPVSPADVAGRSGGPLNSASPARLPRAVEGRPIVCASAEGAVWLGNALPPEVRALPVSGGGADARTPEMVWVPPGAGALVRDQQAPGADLGTVFLITDRGARYPLGGPEAVRALGYGGVPPRPVASTTLALFPIGPTLDAASAQRVATGNP